MITHSTLTIGASGLFYRKRREGEGGEGGGEGGRKGGREKGKEGEREGGRKGGREKGREEREGGGRGRESIHIHFRNKKSVREGEGERVHYSLDIPSLFQTPTRFH